jgi:hypothetical protein
MRPGRYECSSLRPSVRDGSDVGTRSHEPLRIDWFKFLSE